MKQFFKFLLASTLGTFLAIFIAGLFLVTLITMAATSSSNVQVRNNSVLEIDLNRLIPEHSNNIQFDFSDFQTDKVMGVHEMAHTIVHAADDDNIKGIYLKTNTVGGGLVKVDVLREAFETFKESGKFIYAHSKYYTQGAYLLAATADSVYLNPMGLVDFRGFGGVLSFYKNMLDRADVNMQIFYAGKFKGATEPYRRTDLSPENRLQLEQYVNDMYNEYVEDLSRSRGIAQDKLKQIAENYDGGNTDRALSVGLVDAIAYEDEVMDAMRVQLDIEKDKKIRFTSLDKYRSAIELSDDDADDIVAVVYAEGTILDGEGGSGIIGDEPYVEVANKLRRDDDVKAIVLRVNSPGGSAMASENIWRAFTLLNEAGKPVIISMSDFAASGGYYIAAAGDYIFAEENTLTGSIGVFRLLPSLENTFEEHLGITIDTIQTTPFATGFNISKDLNPAQRRYLQAETERTYDIFLQRVADARNMSKEAVNEIAQGRVWTADRAVQNGLVDKIGDLDAAIEYAANAAELDDYRTKNYPRLKTPTEQILEDIFNTDQAKTRLLQAELGEFYEHYQAIKSLQTQSGVQAMMPFRLTIE
ncbi:MAG: signal peptide peptidase SppA [Bacteroidota bacterium]